MNFTQSKFFESQTPENKTSNQPEANTFASDDEKYFSWYLEELQQAGFISNWLYEPHTYRLSALAKYGVFQQSKRSQPKRKRLSLLQSHSYTPDFGIVWTNQSNNIFYNAITDGVDLRQAPFIVNLDTNIPYSIIEIKPVYDKNNMIRLFRINQKWMFFQNRVYVQEVSIIKIFEKSFTPARYLLTKKTKKKRILKYKSRSLQEYLTLKDF